MKSANSNKSGRNARLPNNAVPPGFRYAQPGEQASLAIARNTIDLAFGDEKRSNTAHVTVAFDSENVYTMAYPYTSEVAT